MGGSYFGDAATFLIKTLFDLYILIVMLRFLFQVTRADFYNPLSQFVVKATNPPLRPLRRIVPGVAGIDMSSVVLMLLLKVAELWLVLGIGGVSPQVPGLLVLGVAQLLSLAVYVFMVSVFVQVILSWVSPQAYNPVVSLIHSLNQPLIGPARRLIPSLSGIDFSPIAVIIGLQLVLMLVVAPLTDLGRGLL